MDNDDATIVMEIETQLKDDADGALRTSVAAGIDEQLGAIDAALRRGAAPDDYARLSALKKGLESGKLILDSAWSHFHR